MERDTHYLVGNIHMAELLAVIKGSGEQGSGVAHRLFNAEIRVAITETERPAIEQRAASRAS